MEAESGGGRGGSPDLTSWSPAGGTRWELPCDRVSSGWPPCPSCWLCSGVGLTWGVWGPGLSLGLGFLGLEAQLVLSPKHRSQGLWALRAMGTESQRETLWMWGGKYGTRAGVESAESSPADPTVEPSGQAGTTLILVIHSSSRLPLGSGRRQTVRGSQASRRAPPPRGQSSVPLSRQGVQHSPRAPRMEEEALAPLRPEIQVRFGDRKGGC